MNVHLAVKGFSGLVREQEVLKPFGSLKPFTQLPKRAVRRLSDLERGVAACLMGLDESQENGLGDSAIVLASRYGAMTNTLELLKFINQDEALSPTSFSLSVHNAAVGVASQLTKNHGGHTAIAAGERSLLEGLTECYARIKDGANSIVFMYSDCHLTQEYAEFGDTDKDVQFALLLEEVTIGESGPSHQIEGGSAGALSCLEAINDGVSEIQWKI